MRRGLTASGLLCFGLLATMPAIAAELQLKRVVLSSAGIGYFEHEATVGGDAELELRVRLDQVDDVLKSIVVLDGAGAVAAISLPSRDAPDRLFRDLPFDEGALGDTGALLGALRGAELRLTGQRSITGRVLSVTREETALPNGGAKVTRTRLALLTAAGIEQAILEEADRVEFTDAKLAGQLGDALQGLLARRAAEERTLKLRLVGTTERRVRVGYTIEAPLWKAAYRLVLPQRPDADSATLQGWAVLENLTAQDWRGVELTLVSGNPVTFRQALYTAYHVTRPEVPVEVVGRVLPPADTGTLPTVARDLAMDRAGEMEQRSAVGALRSRAAGASGAPEPSKPAAPALRPGQASNFFETPPPLASATAAETQDATTQVAFTIATPVSAAAGTSLVLPILAQEVPAARLALYQPSVNATNPLAAVRLANRTASGWPPGVLSLYETGSAGLVFVGDARLAPLPAGEDRLLSFAVDQKVAIGRDTRSTEVQTMGKIANGVLTLTTIDRLVTIYRVKGAAGEMRRLVIEHPRDPNGKLVPPEKATVEETRTQYRLARDLAAGETAVIEVAIERPRLATVELLRLDQKTLAVYVKRTELGEALLAKLRRLAELRAAVDAADTDRTTLDQERQRIVSDQERLRANINAVSSGTDLHKRYLDTLRRQEDRLDKLDGELRTAQDRGDKAKIALTDYVQGLSL
jgi:hypothetical protein